MMSFGSPESWTDDHGHRPGVSGPGYLREEHGNSADDSLVEGLAAGGILCP